jgi:hypothetical protein
MVNALTSELSAIQDAISSVALPKDLGEFR